jgi:hypothetical protein
MFTGPGRIIRKRKAIVSTITTGGIANSYIAMIPHKEEHC